jgi:hypothetical protein
MLVGYIIDYIYIYFYIFKITNIIFIFKKTAGSLVHGRTLSTNTTTLRSYELDTGHTLPVTG